MRAPDPNARALCLHALVIGARRRKRADSAVTLMWGAVRSYESIDARPSTLRRLGVVALALVAGFVAAAGRVCLLRGDLQPPDLCQDVLVLGLCLLHLVVFMMMLWVSRTRVKELNAKEIKEMATYLQEDGSGQDEEKKEKMSS